MITGLIVTAVCWLLMLLLSSDDKPARLMYTGLFGFVAIVWAVGGTWGGS